MKVSRYLRTYERMGRKLAYEKFVLWNDEVIDTTKQQTYIELEREVCSLEMVSTRLFAYIKGTFTY